MYVLFITVLFGDLEIAEQILKATSPKVQKSMGRRVKNFDEQIWKGRCIDIVKSGNLAKVDCNYIKKTELIEGLLLNRP